MNGTPYDFDELECLSIDISVDQHLKRFEWTHPRMEHGPPPWERGASYDESRQDVNRRAPGFRDIKRLPRPPETRGCRKNRFILHHVGLRVHLSIPTKTVRPPSGRLIH